VIELYGNWGRGFHSNDVRGAVTSTPVSRPCARHRQGAWRTFPVAALYPHGDLLVLDVASELRFVGDSNAVERAAPHDGVAMSWLPFWRPFTWLAIDGSYTASHSRYDNGDYIPNAFDNAAQAGISAISDRFRRQRAAASSRRLSLDRRQ